MMLYSRILFVDLGSDVVVDNLETAGMDQWQQMESNSAGSIAPNGSKLLVARSEFLLALTFWTSTQLQYAVVVVTNPSI